MIEFIDIKNFQLHKRQKVELDPAATCFIGASDRGKSAIVRALRWLVTNRPSGDDFIRHGSDGVSVTIGIDSREISRRKGKGKNAYELDGKEFNAVRTDVPPEILDILHLSELNFANQLDPPFWFSLSAGQVSKELNQIVNLDQIDRVLEILAKRIRQSQIECGLVRDRCGKVHEELKGLEWVVEADTALFILEYKIKLAEEKRLESRLLRDVLLEAETLTQQEIKAKRAYDRGSEVLELAQKAIQARKDVQSLSNLIETSQTYQQILERPVPMDCWFRVESLWKSCLEKQKEAAHLGNAIVSWEAQEKELTRLKSVVEKAEQELQEETDGICPICGGELP